MDQNDETREEKGSHLIFSEAEMSFNLSLSIEDISGYLSEQKGLKKKRKQSKKKKMNKSQEKRSKSQRSIQFDENDENFLIDFAKVPKFTMQSKEFAAKKENLIKRKCQQFPPITVLPQRGRNSRLMKNLLD